MSIEINIMKSTLQIVLFLLMMCGPGLSPALTENVGNSELQTSLTENVGNSEHETPLVYVEFADQEKGALTKEERKSEMEKDERERHIFVEDTAGSQAIGDDDEHP
ncbi:hypothetical protein ROHU_008725 [Labeo rohita]|uniref:Secreted protein n=1 Tax=Labeo rohita TaxID=84645 RepID=A0A498M3V1_LABRO|nr:hypothetical protein ROHU_008725 [Labeo rohita]